MSEPGVPQRVRTGWHPGILRQAVGAGPARAITDIRGFRMIRPIRRPLAAAVLFAATALLTLSNAGEAPQQQIDAPPPKDYVIPAKGIKDYVRKAVESPDRPAYMKVHDAYRKPAELFDLAGIKPNSKVVELSSYGNYWSTMLASIVSEKGQLHLYDHKFAEPLAKQGQAFAAAHKNTTYEIVDHNQVEFPKGIDLVWCYACYHELMLAGTQLTPFQTKLFKAMKPGGVLLVVFFKARDGTETDDTGTLHRIDQAIVRAQLQGTGFTLEAEEFFLQNHDDDHSTKVFSEKESDLADKVIFKFRKTVSGG
jgi:predicted methyltransferase